jgi:hypothetical protein
MTHLLTNLAQATGLLYMTSIASVAFVAAFAPTPQQRADARATLDLLIRWLTKDKR